MRPSRGEVLRSGVPGSQGVTGEIGLRGVCTHMFDVAAGKCAPVLRIDHEPGLIVRVTVRRTMTDDVGILQNATLPFSGYWKETKQKILFWTQVLSKNLTKHNIACILRKIQTKHAFGVSNQREGSNGYCGKTPPKNNHFCDKHQVIRCRTTRIPCFLLQRS